MSNLNPRDSSGSVVSTGRSGSRQQIKRSFTELASPVKLSRHHRKERHYDEKASQSVAAVTPYLQPQALQKDRISLDLPRSEAVTPMMTPDQSRRASLMLQRDEEARIANALNQLQTKADREERLREEREKASLRVEYVPRCYDMVTGILTVTL